MLTNVLLPKIHALDDEAGEVFHGQHRSQGDYLVKDVKDALGIAVRTELFQDVHGMILRRANVPAGRKFGTRLAGQKNLPVLLVEG